MNEIALNDAINYFDKFIAYKLPYLEIPGLSIAVRHNNDIVYSRTLGKANTEHGTSFNKDTLCRVASNSKMFTAAALLQLKDRGKLQLDDPVTRYVPWVRDHKDPRWQAVTIRQLLSHRAGISRDSSRSGYWSLQATFPSADELKRAILDDDLIYEPDTVMKYSNYGFSLLGQVIEAVTGEPYNVHVTKNVIEKLGLRSTYPDINEDIITHLVTGYTAKTASGRRLPIDQIDTGALSPATGFVSTPTDMTHFMAAIFGKDASLLSHASIQEMQRIHAKVTYGRGAKTSYGLGLELGEINEQIILSHGGGFPGQVTETLFIPSLQISLSIVINGLGVAPMTITRSLLSCITWFRSSYKEAPQHDLSHFTVRYAHLWGETDIVGYGDSLIRLNLDLPLDFTNAEQLKRVSTTKLLIEKASSFSGPGETMSYIYDSNGRLSHLNDQGTIAFTVDRRDALWDTLTKISVNVPKP